MNDDLFGAAMTELVKVLERIAAALEAAQQPVAADEYTIALRTKELEEQGWKPFAQDALRPGGTIMRRPRQQPAPAQDAADGEERDWQADYKTLRAKYDGLWTAADEAQRALTGYSVDSERARELLMDAM